METSYMSIVFGKIRKQRSITSVVAFAVLFIILALTANNFLSSGNWSNIVKQTAVVGCTAVGMTFVIITAGIDLSVGSIQAFCCVLCAQTLVAFGDNSNSVAAIAAAILVSVLCSVILGGINGVLVANLRLPAFIVTFGMMGAARGAALLYTNGGSISIRESPTFRIIAEGKIAGFPVPGVIMILLFIIGWTILNKTRFGYYVFAVGGNEESSRLSGINTKLVLLIVYIISGICTGVASVILVARLGTGQPISGDGLEMDAIAATVIGGTSLAGGRGSLFGTFVGAFFIILIKNGLNLLNINAYWQEIAVGVAVVIAVAIDATLSSKKKN